MPGSAPDFAGRFGGDEFVVLLNEVSNRADARAARDNLKDILSMPLQFLVDMGPQASALAPTAAIGIAMCPDDANDIDTLLHRVDEDMYRRKRARKPLAAV
jgi:diguanylate cyclase (GGDEF)-like protein